MLKEKLGPKEDFDSVRTLAPQTKIRKLLEIFDLGKDKEKNSQRKQNFIELMGRYHQSGIKYRSANPDLIRGSDESKKKLHNEIMEVIKSISISRGLSREQEQLAEYLARNREEVEKIIGVYFLGHNPSDPREASPLRQAQRGEGLFTSPPGKENE